MVLRRLEIRDNFAERDKATVKAALERFILKNRVRKPAMSAEGQTVQG